MKLHIEPLKKATKSKSWRTLPWTKSICSL